MADLDVTGANEIVTLFEELAEADVDMWLTRLHGTAREVADRTGATEIIGEARFFTTTDEAFAALDSRTRRGPAGEPLDG